MAISPSTPPSTRLQTVLKGLDPGRGVNQDQWGAVGPHLSKIIVPSRSPNAAGPLEAQPFTGDNLARLTGSANYRERRTR